MRHEIDANVADNARPVRCNSHASALAKMVRTRMNGGGIRQYVTKHAKNHKMMAITKVVISLD
jgi:hypothetical protein